MKTLTQLLIFGQILLLTVSDTSTCLGQVKPGFHLKNQTQVIHPLDTVFIDAPLSWVYAVSDPHMQVYAKASVAMRPWFIAAGAPGKQHIHFYQGLGREVAKSSFFLEPTTLLDDRGTYRDMFNLFKVGMGVYNKAGYDSVTVDDKTYRFFVPWILDNSETQLGMQYFSPHGSELADLMQKYQRSDGMIWSFVSAGDPSYFKTAYSPSNYFLERKGAFFARQPTENHVEYLYVNLIYQSWKASGDHAWMLNKLASAGHALDYSMTDASRWSTRYGLLKRAYTIDSWDFQIDDKYTPALGIGNAMLIDPLKTTFGIFFGDNTGYAQACHQLAEMYDSCGNFTKAREYNRRGSLILERLGNLAWNGRFYTHRIEENDSVHHSVGVDERSQISLGNMYSLNRGIGHEKSIQIIRTYQQLLKNLPEGAPAEWYSIYPPFQKGFGSHNEVWQYMNGGIAGHAAGELARGAFENGEAQYGHDVLLRLYHLGKENGNRISFAYTGAFPKDSSTAKFETINIQPEANMSLCTSSRKKSGKIKPWLGSNEPGNDLSTIPAGLQTFNGIPFEVLDPAPGKSSVIGLSQKEGFQREADIPLHRYVSSIYLLHTCSSVGRDKVAGTFTIHYEDGSSASRYIFVDQAVSGWWFPTLNGEIAKVAWAGPNLKSARVGVCQAVFNNDYPSKKIASISFHASLDGSIYALLALSTSNHEFKTKAPLVSYGGPDNWAAATAMAALIEGAAGVKNTGLAFQRPTLTPKWMTNLVRSVNVCVQFPASDSYIAYAYHWDSSRHQIRIGFAGTGKHLNIKLPIPKDGREFSSVSLTQNGRHITLKPVHRTGPEQEITINDLQITGYSELYVDY